MFGESALMAAYDANSERRRRASEDELATGGSGGGPDYRTLAVRWLVSQSVPTVLLCAILAFLGYTFIYLVPQHLSAIQDGYARNAEQLEKSIDKMVESHEKDRQVWLDLINKSQR